MAKATPKRYSVTLTARALRDLKKIITDATARRRIGAAIDALEANPRPNGAEKLSGDDEAVYRIRVGDYRILYAIEDAELAVTVVRVGHRREVYR